MNILITNDDGIYADGILALKKEIEKVGRVFVVAPDRPRSGCGHSITLHKPLRADKVSLRDGGYGYASNGTPSDCVHLGLFGLFEEHIDLVISGINDGPNLGWDLTYSGTVSAALEGVIGGIKSIAVSVAKTSGEVDFSIAAKIAAQAVKILESHNAPDSTLLNINVPNLLAAEIKGIRVTRQGTRRYSGKTEKRIDPKGRAYYWIGGELPTDSCDEGTDVKAIADGYVSITPIHLDLTDPIALNNIQEWGLQDIQTGN